MYLLRRCRSPSSCYLQPSVFVDANLAGGESCLQGVHVERRVLGEGVPGWEVLALHLTPAAGAVELDDPDPVTLRREGVLALQDRLVDLARVALGDEQAAFVVLAQVAQVTAAVVAVPPLRRQVCVEVLGHAKQGARHGQASFQVSSASPRLSVARVQPWVTSHV